MITNQSHFSLKYKTLWGLLSFGTSVISGTFAALLNILYQDYLGLPAQFFLYASIIYGIWNAFNDPIFGYISDSSKSPKGRRIPFMRYTLPFLGLFFIMVWLVPQNWPPTSIFWWMLITMLAYDTCFTIIVLAYYALLPELTENDKGRGELQVFLSIGLLLGSMLGFVIPDMVRPANASDLPQLYIGMIIIAVICVGLSLITTYAIKERPEVRSKVIEPLKFTDSVKYTISSKSFLIVTAANFMVIFTQAIVTGAMFYLEDYVLPFSALSPVFIFFAGLFIGVFFVNYLSRKLGVCQTQQILSLLSGIGLILITFSPNLFLIYGAMALAGFGIAGPLVLTNVQFAQVADEDEFKRGSRREGTFFGINAFFTKPAQSIAIALPPFLLELANFITREENEGLIEYNQPAEAKFMIRVIIGLIPGIAMILAAVILQFNPLRKKEYLHQVQTRILEIHTQNLTQ